MSTETKVAAHTPGPWRNEGLFVHHSVSRGDSGIAYVYADFAGCPVVEAEANARLIAACPEMLEALEAAVRIMKATYGLPQFAWLPGYNGKTFNENLMSIESVLAKARGAGGGRQGESRGAETD